MVKSLVMMGVGLVSVSASGYTLGEFGSNTCPEGYEKFKSGKGCGFATGSLERIPSHISPDWPDGCFQYEGKNGPELWVNVNDAGGSGHPKSRVVCKLVGLMEFELVKPGVKGNKLPGTDLLTNVTIDECGAACVNAEGCLSISFAEATSECSLLGDEGKKGEKDANGEFTTYTPLVCDACTPVYGTCDGMYGCRCRGGFDGDGYVNGTGCTLSGFCDRKFGSNTSPEGLVTDDECGQGFHANVIPFPKIKQNCTAYPCDAAGVDNALCCLASFACPETFENDEAMNHFVADCSGAVSQKSKCAVTLSAGYVGGSVTCDATTGNYTVMAAETWMSAGFSSNACPNGTSAIMTDAAQCEAVVGLGSGAVSTEDRPDYPGGCYQHTSTRAKEGFHSNVFQYYFNTNTGSEEEWSSLICTAEAPVATIIIKAENNTAACPWESFALSKAECEDEALKQEKTFTLLEAPTGCFQEGERFFYNAKQEAKANEQATLVCRKGESVEIILSKLKENECPERSEPLSKDECESYALSEEASFKEKTFSTYPKGCYLRYGKYFWNKHKKGRRNNKAQAVCRTV